VDVAEVEEEFVYNTIVSNYYINVTLVQLHLVYISPFPPPVGDFLKETDRF